MQSYQKEKLLILSCTTPKLWRSGYEYFNTWFVFLVNCFFLQHIMNASILFILPFTILQGLIILRIFMLQHDCGHYALFKSRKINNLAGMLCSLVTPLTYHYWRDTHAIHHKENGDLSKRPWIGNITVLTPEEFKALSRSDKRKYMASRSCVMLLLFGWLVHFYYYRLRPPVSHQKNVATKNNLISVYATNLTQLIFFILYPTQF